MFMVVLRFSLLFFLLLCPFAVSQFFANDSVPHSIVSFNARIGTAKDGVNSWKNRRTSVIKMLKEKNPIVVGFQESQWQQTSYIKRKMPNLKVAAGKWWFVPILYDQQKVTLQASGLRWLSQTPKKMSRGWDAAHHRVVAWAQLKLIDNDASFLVFNTHLDHKGVVARKESVKLLVQMVDEINVDSLPVLLVGDFNISQDDELLLPILRKFDNSRTCSPTTDSLATYNAFNAAFNGVIIDHIFTQKIVCKKYATLVRDFGVPFISDHYPVSLYFDF